MRNIFLQERTALDIDRRIERIHADLGIQDGRVELARVRELLKLDLRYYRADDPHLLAEVVHKLKVGAHNLLQGPRSLLDAVKEFGLRAVLLPKPRRILIDETLPDLKKRWGEGHEIAHSLIPWHEGYMLGDTKQTLSPTCREQIEAEANHGCARLLFPAEAFATAAASSPPSIGHVRKLADQFGNTITSTLWRYVEGYRGVAFGLVGRHPQYAENGKADVEYFIRSRSLEEQFPDVTEAELFVALRGICTRRRGGPIGAGLIELVDANGERRSLTVEAFSNTHQTLTLGHVK